MLQMHCLYPFIIVNWLDGCQGISLFWGYCALCIYTHSFRTLSSSLSCFSAVIAAKQTDRTEVIKPATAEPNDTQCGGNIRVPI